MPTGALTRSACSVDQPCLLLHHAVPAVPATIPAPAIPAVAHLGTDPRAEARAAARDGGVVVAVQAGVRVWLAKVEAGVQEARDVLKAPGVGRVVAVHVRPAAGAGKLLRAGVVEGAVQLEAGVAGVTMPVQIVIGTIAIRSETRLVRRPRGRAAGEASPGEAQRVSNHRTQARVVAVELHPDPSVRHPEGRPRPGIVRVRRGSMILRH